MRKSPPDFWPPSTSIGIGSLVLAEFRIVSRILIERAEHLHARFHCAGLRVLPRVKAAISFRDRLRGIPREIVPEVFEIDPLASLHKRQRCLLEGFDTRDRASERTTDDRGVEIDPNGVHLYIPVSGCYRGKSSRVAPRPGLEPGTCGLTVRPVIPWKAAPVNDLDQNGG